MNFYHLKLGSGLSIDQNAIVQALNQAGAATIQTSDGLFTAADLSDAEIKSVLAKTQEPLPALDVVQVDPSAPGEGLTPDMKNLMEKHSH